MTLNQDTINSILLISITISGAVVTAIWMGLILWTWRDMHLRSRDLLAQIAASLMVAVLGIFGVIIYVMLRPPETLAEAYERSLEEEALLQNIEERAVCPGCGRPTTDEWQVCPYCHTKLKKPCLNCGRMLELPWNLCPYCAASQVDQGAMMDAPRARSIASQLGATPTPPPGYGNLPEDEMLEFIEDDNY
ncbi:MAG: zinc ribbon domain-containing protein [Anaerolineae bacterium]|jgi:RNA polymerase subunit RPABC4/transcription elongation factor Spt4|nr:zinc ribbon domain-containing protein [Anaerolineae bacterium]